MTVNSERYADMLVNFALPARDEFVNEDTLFQQDRATSHTAKISRGLLKLAFFGHINSRNGNIPSPVCSLD